ncbi:hypothetical protein [Noviherbaspirillum saxi]|uniref:Uncharacterized protein n=1 Tax=Noviherbaspirillum saxi TaxID=2320863 RepID=A0A3A3FUV1_9BURK|nr:hypothetical protein [Noviherbaspirillum saxi]RJF98328.1 hypothetical protein D3871_07220 [Noviherbaspirillum saxi]
MDLHQLQVIYQAEEDRLLFRASFKSDSGLHELRAWLTRRLLTVLWPAIRNALETQVKLDKPQAAHASADIVGMEHQVSVEHIRDSGSFNNAYEADITDYPLGETPLLITTVNFSQLPDEPIRINMTPANGTGFEVAFTLVVLHGLCSLLKDAVNTAEWDLVLEMPGEAKDNTGPRVFN